MGGSTVLSLDNLNYMYIYTRMSTSTCTYNLHIIYLYLLYRGTMKNIAFVVYKIPQYFAVPGIEQIRRFVDVIIPIVGSRPDSRG